MNDPAHRPRPVGFSGIRVQLADHNSVANFDLRQHIPDAVLGKLLDVERRRLAAEDDRLAGHLHGEVLDPPAGPGVDLFGEQFVERLRKGTHR